MGGIITGWFYFPEATAVFRFKSFCMAGVFKARPQVEPCFPGRFAIEGFQVVLQASVSLRPFTLTATASSDVLMPTLPGKTNWPA